MSSDKALALRWWWPQLPGCTLQSWAETAAWRGEAWSLTLKPAARVDPREKILIRLWLRTPGYLGTGVCQVEIWSLTQAFGDGGGGGGLTLMSQWLLCALELCPPPPRHRVCLFSRCSLKNLTPSIEFCVCVLEADTKNTSISSSSLQTVSPTVRLLMYGNVINN